jgi:hypothetical protein
MAFGRRCFELLCRVVRAYVRVCGGGACSCVQACMFLGGVTEEDVCECGFQTHHGNGFQKTAAMWQLFKWWVWSVSYVNGIVLQRCCPV